MQTFEAFEAFLNEASNLILTICPSLSLVIRSKAWQNYPRQKEKCTKQGQRK